MSRIVRHWKQEFTPAGPFIFTKAMQLEGRMAEAGATVPEDLAQPLRMQVWWKAGVIALKNWDYDLGCPGKPTYDFAVPPPPPVYEDRGGGWYLFPDGSKVHGKKALAKKLASMEA